MVWTGYGILNVAIAALSVAMVEFLAQLAGTDIEEQNWPASVALMLSGVVVWFLGKALHHIKDRSIQCGAELGKFDPAGTQHSLLLIKMEYWGPIFAGIGIVLLLWD